GGPANSEEEPSDDEERKAVRDKSDEKRRNDRDDADRREHHTRPEAVGESTDGNPSERADDHRHGHRDGHLERGELELAAVGVAQRGDEVPGPEVHQEPDGGEREHGARRAGRPRGHALPGCRLAHWNLPRRPPTGLPWWRLCTASTGITSARRRTPNWATSG